MQIGYLMHFIRVVKFENFANSSVIIPYSYCYVHPPDIISDYGLVVCWFVSALFTAVQVIRQLHPWKKLNLEAFTASIRSSELCDDMHKL